MLAGLVGTVAVPKILEQLGYQGEYQLSAMEQFPWLLAFTLAGCLLGSLLTPAEDMEVLKNFYRKTRPWGFWGPVRDQVLKEDPTFVPNTDFWRDMFNVVVGIAWQMGLVVAPMYLVFKMWNELGITLAVVAVTSVILKFNWWDRLEA